MFFSQIRFIFMKFSTGITSRSRTYQHGFPQPVQNICHKSNIKRLERCKKHTIRHNSVRNINLTDVIQSCLVEKSVDCLHISVVIL